MIDPPAYDPEQGYFTLDESVIVTETAHPGLAVRLTHVATGEQAIGDKAESQNENRKFALAELEQRLRGTPNELTSVIWQWREIDQ